MNNLRLHWTVTGGLLFIICGIVLEGLTPRPVICQKGYFACNNSLACVEQRHNCDGKSDCEDGSDEWNCEDKHDKEFWNNFFKKRPDEDAEKRIHICNLDNYPSECFCSQDNLYCENRELKEVPKNLPTNTSELELSGNRIAKLRRDDFKDLRKLTVLILLNSGIVEIEDTAFRDLLAVQRIYLVGNNLTHITYPLFVNNTDLKLLDLGYNNISKLDPSAFQGLYNLHDLDLRNNRLEALPEGIFDDLHSLRTLHVSMNRLQHITPGVFNSLAHLHTLYLTKNEITVIEPYSFTGMWTLHELMLSWNKIETLQDATFDNLTTLLVLNIDSNHIKSIEANAFQSLVNLKSLNLKENHFRKVSSKIFEPLTSLTHIYFQEFYMCAYALHVRICEPKGDGISSLENLLDSVVLRISVWVVATLACLGNTFVLIGRILIKEPNEVHSFYIKNLSLSDFFMGLYLFVIAGYDLHFRGEYIRHEEEWRQSWQCEVCGFLSTVSSEASVFILSIITFDRYTSIIYPLSQKRRTLGFAVLCMVSVWTAAIAIAVLPLFGIPYYGDEFYGNNGVCLPLHIHDPFAQAWEYSAVMFIGVNFVAFAFILFAYVKMFVIIKDSTVSLRSTQEKQDRIIAKRFAFIVGTDFVCWMPIIFIKILALTGVPINEKLYAWLAVFVLPVNSALNPILYTLTTKVFKQQAQLKIPRQFLKFFWRKRPYLKKMCRFVYTCLPRGARSSADSSGLSLSYAFFYRQSTRKKDNVETTNTVSTARSSVKSVSSRTESTKRRLTATHIQLSQWNAIPLETQEGTAV